MATGRHQGGGMTGTFDKEKGEARPDLVHNYRPVAIRSVLAAYVMIPKSRPDSAFKSSPPEMGPALPPGFHSSPED